MQIVLVLSVVKIKQKKFSAICPSKTPKKSDRELCCIPFSASEKRGYLV